MANKKESLGSGYSIVHRRLFQMLRWAAIIFVLITIQLPTSHTYIKWGVYVVLAIAVIALLQLPTGQIHRFEPASLDATDLSF